MPKMKITLVLALLVLLCSSVAFASQVKYSTCFGTTATPCLATGTVSAGTLTAKYSHTTTVTVNDPIALNGLNRNFGTLIITCSGSCPSTATVSFSVTISQTMPGTGHATVTATLTGTFVISNNTVAVTWSGPVVIHAGGFTTFYNPIDAGKTCTTLPCNLPLKVDISQLPGTVFLPEPSAELLLGLGSLSLMVLATLSRKMISA